jgi:5'-phosphate synthase pdxT subunit
MASHDDVPVLVRQGSVMVASFHPELAGDARLHRMFVQHNEIRKA